MIQAKIDTMQNAKFDNLYTPVHAVLPLMKYIPDDFKFFWECCDPGNSAITKVLTENDKYVLSSDIKNGFDFLKDTPGNPDPIHAIITNPPYSLKDQFIERCYELQKPFALLLPLTSLEGIHRNKIFGKHGISVIVLDKRIDFTGKKACWFNVSWFIWGFTEPNKLFFENVEAQP